MIRRHDLAPALDQRPVGIEQKLGIVNGISVALVDTDRDDHVRLFRGLADRTGFRGGDGDRLLHEPQLLLRYCEGGQHEGEVGVVGDHGLGKGCELHALRGEFTDLLHNLLDGPVAAVQYGAELHGGSFDDGAHVGWSSGLDRPGVYCDCDGPYWDAYLLSTSSGFPFSTT